MDVSTQKNLLQALNLEDFPLKEQEEMLLSVGDLVFKNSLVKLLEQMDDAMKDAFAALLEKNPSEEEVVAFLQKVPGADKAVAETVQELTDDILAATK
ncbi:MAG: hypothetical protein WAV21_03265 [Minisyncoccia bacterium]